MLISWKQSFSRLKDESDVARKKKQALDELLKTGRISPSTYDLFSKEITETIAEIEKQQTALLGKVNSKMMELADQIKTLEMLLANAEIQHVAGEMDEEIYQRQVALLSVGLDAARREVETVRETANQLSSGAAGVQKESDLSHVECEVSQGEPPVKPLSEPLPHSDESQSAEKTVEGEEKQQT